MPKSVAPVRPALARPDRHEWFSLCVSTTREHGLAAGLATALGGVGPTGAPGGIAAVPSSSVAAGDEVVPDPIAEMEGVALVAVPEDPCSSEVLLELAAALGVVRLTLAEQVLERAVAHLSGRVAGGEALMRKPMLIADVAGIGTAITALSAQVRLPSPDAGVLADLHDDITALEWELAKLFGAGGFLVTGPVRALHVSRLVANCWVPNESERRW